MEKRSRREFIKSCLYLVSLGFSSGLCSLGVSCERTKGPSASKTQCPERDEFLNPVEKAGSTPKFEPAYLRLHQGGELKRRHEELWQLMEECRLCPRECGVNRLAGEKGFCTASSQLEVTSHNPHFGEERPLVGEGGSGTIFFTHCGLRCVFCINWEVSQGRDGKPCTVEELAGMMLHLQEIGCHNINLVTPTHYSPHIILAVDIAAGKGLRLPLVYNTHGWERVEILRMLEGIVDIYLPDFKYADAQMASKYSSGADTYPEVTKMALLEMNRQVGVAKPAEDGIIYRGLMIRHLVMPSGVSGTRAVIQYIAQNLPKDTYLNLMSQYIPVYKAFDYPEISRRITKEEYRDSVRWAKEAGLTNLDIQGYPFF